MKYGIKISYKTLLLLLLLCILPGGSIVLLLFLFDREWLKRSYIRLRKRFLGVSKDEGSK